MKLIVILGPTASGKTNVALKAAKKFNGEIISADSRQIYKGMNIGTAKPPRSQKSKVKSQKYIVDDIPHYLINMVYPNEDFNVAIFKKSANKIIKDIQKRNKLPFLVGGTGLYIKAVVDNIQFPKIKSQVKLRKELEKKSIEKLFKIYKKLDPKGAKIIDKKNKRRLIRAIEVSKITKKPFSEQRKKGKPLFSVLKIGIKIEKDELKKKIKKRVKKMIKSGLEKEVKNLIKKYNWETPALQTIGYYEWKEYFNKKISKKELEEKIIKNTQDYAKRQITWVNKDKEIVWVKNYREAEKLINKFL